ncbi:sugar ABC transporter permease [Spirochaetia bacterium]|nr:sugar ABC transporter permease [Spirochaetia bacterium]
MIAKGNRRIRRSPEDRVIDTVVMIICVLVLIVTAYPFYYSIILSFNDGKDALRGGIYLWPRAFSLENYKAVLRIDYIYTAAIVTVMRTLIGTIATLIFTGLFAYSLSHSNLRFRKFYMVAMIITMYFSGGLIPYYMTLRFLGLMNNFLVYIIPGLLNAFYVIIMISFFKEIPDSLEEAAKIDGAGYMHIFFRIILPVSTPLLATMALFIGVYHWNAWSDAAFFITNKNLKTLSYVLINLINQTEAAAQLAQSGMGTIGVRQAAIVGETLRPAAMMIVVAPIIMIYPFLQKYFVKGIMIGSVKG